MIRSCLLVIIAFAGESALIAAPTATSIFPPGGQRGTTVDVVIAGTFPTWPVTIWCSEPKLTFKPSKTAGQLTITIPSDTLPGVVHWRFADDKGASQLVPFIIGTIPELLESEPNNDIASAQAIVKACVVNGKLQKSGDVDAFTVNITKEQTLVASLEGNWDLKSPMDAVLQIVSERGVVLAQNHDARGLDPALHWIAPETCRVVVRVFAFPSQPDSSIRFAGGETYLYRLTLTTGPYLVAAEPIAPNDALLHGVSLPADPKFRTVPWGERNGESIAFHPEWPGVVRLQRPATLRYGHLQKPGNKETFRLETTPGKPLRVSLESRVYGYQVAGKLTVLDAQDQVLAKTESADLVKDCELVVTPKNDSVRVVVQDQAGAAGPWHSYWLRVEPDQPDFEVSLSTDLLNIPVGKAVEFPMTVTARGGFSGELTARCEPAIAGLKIEVVPGAKGKTRTYVLKFTAQQKIPGQAMRVIVSSPGLPEKSAQGSSASLGQMTPHLWIW